MLESFPVRRDPRPLVLVPQGNAIEYAALDAWEVRGIGTLALSNSSPLRLALVRLLIQIRPSACVIAELPVAPRGNSQALQVAVRSAVGRSGVPVLVLERELLPGLLTASVPLEAMLAAYPELQAVETPLPEIALGLAMTLLSSLTLSPRRYAATCSARSRASVASRCARCTRKASFPHRSSTRRQPPNRPSD